MQQATNHNQIISFIWNIANKLRGPYRPPQYRRVMLPMVVLRRFDLVLAENKDKVLNEKKRLEAKGISGPALEKALSRIAASDHNQELFNTSGFTFEKLLGDAPNIAGNLIAYIRGFSQRARDIFDKEVLPHVPDAWIDHNKTKIGYEIPLTRHFYIYKPPRPLETIAQEIKELEKEITSMLSEVL